MADTAIENNSVIPYQGASAASGRHYWGLLLNVLSTFIVSVSMGMNAIIFPVSMKEKGLTNSLIGSILSLEVIGSLLVCLAISRLIAILHLTTAFILSAIIRCSSILFLILYEGTYSWAALIFLHGIGAFSFLILLQTWANAIPFRKFKGLMVALYSTAISLGLAAGPLVLSWVPDYSDSIMLLTQWIGFEVSSGRTELPFFASAMITLFAVVPVLFSASLAPNFRFEQSTPLYPIIKQSQSIMFATAMAGVSFFGVSSFITLYGLRNGLSIMDASLLLSFFMLGSLLLEAPLSFLSDFIDRRYVIMTAVFLSVVCAVFLPITIYVAWQAWVLVFIWGGIIGAVYSVALTILGERYEGPALVSANAGYSLMESIGGILGVMMIGVAMDVFDSDGLPYIIMFAGILYFTYALTRYRVE